MKIKRKINSIKQNRNGFTLIELLIVISIMGIITVVGVASYVTVQIKSRDSRRKSDLGSLSKALNMYYNDVGSFPYEVGDPNIDSMIKAVGVGFSANVNGKVMTYMVEVPRETTKGVEYYDYRVGATGKSFKLFANLENEEDSNCLKDESGNVLSTFDDYSISSGCILGVSSSNIKIGDDLL